MGRHVSVVKRELDRGHLGGKNNIPISVNGLSGHDGNPPDSQAPYDVHIGGSLD